MTLNTAIEGNVAGSLIRRKNAIKAAKQTEKTRYSRTGFVIKSPYRRVVWARVSGSTAVTGTQVLALVGSISGGAVLKPGGLGIYKS